MYTEVIPGLYLCKLDKGVAYYLVHKELYDKYHTQYNGQSSSRICDVARTMLPLIHLLSGKVFNNYFGSIQLVNWQEMSKNYQLDAIACNEDIRKKYYEEFYGTKPNQVQDLKNKLFGVVDDTTRTLRTLRTTGQIVNDLPMVESVSAEPIHLRPRQIGHLSSGNYVGHGDTHLPLDYAGLANNSNNNKATLPLEGEPYKTQSMDLLSNIPGMSLNFGKLLPGLIALSYDGQLAFSDKKGGFVTIQHEGTEKTRVDVGSLKLDIDFYKVPTQTVEEGDVILLDNELLIAGKKANGETKFINPVTGATTNKLQRTNILGMYFYTKVVSLLDMAGGGKGLGLSGLNPMTLMLLTQGNTAGGGDLGKLLLFSQMGQGGDTNSMLPLLLMSGGLGGNTTGNGGIEQLLMMQALSGNKGGLGNLFGGKAKAAPKVIKKATPRKKTAAKKTAGAAKA